MMRLARAGALLATLLTGSGAAAQIACLPVDRIDLDGVTLLSAEEARAAVTPFEGKCLDLASIDGVLQALTLAYVEKGYVTARAYLPEQDVSDRVLDISVVEGRLAGIRFNGEENRRWQRVVFPGLIGKPVQLRQVEQGLDIIRGMPSYDAEIDISAGEEEGDSILNITATAPKRWQLSIGVNNNGSRQDATETTDPGDPATQSTYTGTIGLTIDHLLGLNETWRLDVSRGTETYPFDLEDGDYATERIEFGLRLPYGPWALNLTHLRSSYDLSSFGTISNIPSDGWTQETRVALSRLLTRGQQSKTTLTGTLEWRENQDRVSEIVIDASSRRLSSIRLDLDHERAAFGGTLNLGIGAEQGLKLFGAEVIEDETEGQPEAQFSLIDADLRYQRAFALGKGTAIYTGELRGQWAFDQLHSNYQLNLGGVSTVRGISRSLVFGGRGVLWRNELAYAPAWEAPDWLGQVQLYGALDAGQISSDLGQVPGRLAGAAVGIRTVGGPTSLDLGWHQILDVPAGVDRPGGELLFSVTRRF